MKKATGTAALLLAATILLACPSCGKTDKTVSKTSFAFDTVITITLYGGYDESIIDACFDLCTKYEKMFSRTDPDSELLRLNNRLTDTISDETAALIDQALYYCRLSGGAFDITVGALSDLWNFGGGNSVPPSPEALEKALAAVNYKGVAVSGDTVTFAAGGTIIDLGGIAKGYIADRLAEYLEACGVKSAIINLGGNIQCVGEKPDGSDFSVGIKYPFGAENETISVLSVSGMSVVTSGVYERYFEYGGTLYHHILDPKTGYPYNNGLLSATVICKNSAEADALSTVCFALGLEAGTALAESLDGVHVVFVTDDYTLHFTKGAEDFISG